MMERSVVVTVKQVAEMANVAVPTAYQALRDDGRLSAATRARVREVAGQLGYRPNTYARAVRKGRFNALGLLSSVVRGRSNPLLPILTGVQAEVCRRGMQLLIAEMPDDQLTSEGYVPNILKELMVDGLVVNYTHDIPEKMLNLVQMYRVPAVWTNTRLKANCIYPDEVAAGRMAGRILLEAGHRHIAFFSASRNDHYSHEDRYLGFRRVMGEAGLTPVDWRAKRWINRPAVHERALALFRSEDGPTAVIAFSDTDTYVAMYAASLAGRTVPDDLSIIAIDGGPVAQIGLNVDTVLVPFQQVGQDAVKMLARRLTHRSEDIPARKVAPQLGQGQTVRPMP